MQSDTPTTYKNNKTLKRTRAICVVCIYPCTRAVSSPAPEKNCYIWEEDMRIDDIIIIDVSQTTWDSVVVLRLSVFISRLLSSLLLHTYKCTIIVVLSRAYYLPRRRFAFWKYLWQYRNNLLKRETHSMHTTYYYRGDRMFFVIIWDNNL